MNINKMNNNNTSLTSYLFGWLSMFFGSLTLNDWAVVVGMIATIFGFFVNWYYKHLEYKRNQRNFVSNKNGNQKKNRK